MSQQRTLIRVCRLRLEGVLLNEGFELLLRRRRSRPASSGNRTIVGFLVGQHRRTALGSAEHVLRRRLFERREELRRSGFARLELHVHREQFGDFRQPRRFRQIALTTSRFRLQHVVVDSRSQTTAIRSRCFGASRRRLAIDRAETTGRSFVLIASLLDHRSAVGASGRDNLGVTRRWTSADCTGVEPCRTTGRVAAIQSSNELSRTELIGRPLHGEATGLQSLSFRTGDVAFSGVILSLFHQAPGSGVVTIRRWF